MDEELIIKRLEYILGKLKDLKYDLEKYDITEDERSKLTIRGAIERWCEEIIESAVIVNNELLSQIGKIPNSYYNSFIELRNLDIFDNDKFIEKISSTAGYRNRLAHDYMNINSEISIKSAKNILKIYKEYIKKIQKYIQKI